MLSAYEAPPSTASEKSSLLYEEVLAEVKSVGENSGFPEETYVLVLKMRKK